MSWRMSSTSISAGLVLDAASSLYLSCSPKETPQHSERGDRAFLAPEITAVRCELHKNGVRGNVRVTLIMQQGWRLESAESSGGRLGTKPYRAAPLSTKEGATASSALLSEVIDVTEDAGIGGSSSPPVTARGIGFFYGRDGGSGSSPGMMEPATPPVKRGTLENWTVGKSSPRFIVVSHPKPSQHARTRAYPNPPESKTPREPGWRSEQTFLGSSRQQQRDTLFGDGLCASAS